MTLKVVVFFAATQGVLVNMWAPLPEDPPEKPSALRKSLRRKILDSWNDGYLRVQAELLQNELDFLIPLLILPHEWGYDAQYQRHTKFEDAMKGKDYYSYLTDYSDPLFRNLDKICRLGEVVVRDVHEKFHLAGIGTDYVAESMREMRERAQIAVRTWLRVPGVCAALNTLMNWEWDQWEATANFVGLIFAAKAVWLIARGDFAEARDYALAYSTTLDEIKKVVRDDDDD